MSSAKHTPGPWELCEKGDYEVFCGLSRVILDADLTRRLAVVHVSDKETEANARLIASAPELLDALKYAKERLIIIQGSSEPLVDEAIAKATGAANESR